MRDSRIRATTLSKGIALALGAQAFSIAAFAQQTPAETIYVFGDSLERTLPQELATYGSDLVTIGRDTMDENAYVDVTQALQMRVPGLYISPVGPFSYSYISIQGSRTGRYDASDVLWLVDGVRLNNRMYPSTLSDTLPANMVERIEVLKGGESLFYGTSAVGGVVNIVTRDFVDRFDGDVSLSVDNNDSYSLSGMVRGPVGSGNYVFYASQDESDGYEVWVPREPSATHKDRGYDVSSVGAKYGVDFGDSLRLTAQIQHTEAELDDLRPTLRREGHNDRNEEIASVKLDYLRSDATQFFIKAYYHDWDTLYTNINNVIGSPGAIDVLDQNAFWGFEDYGLNALAKFGGGQDIEYLAGYDYQRYNARDEVWRIDQITETVHAVFGQIRSSDDTIENGSVAFGVRHNDSGDASATVWNMTGRYDLSERLYFQGSLSTNFVLPSAEQLFLNEPGQESGQGNPDLDPEESRNVNVSLGSSTDMGYWQVTAFHREIKDIIAASDPSPTYPDGIFLNMGEATIEGFEILGGLPISDSLQFEASYTNAKSRLEGQDRQMNANPRYHAKTSLHYDGGRFGGAIAARYVGDVHVSTNATFGLVEYGGYTVADLSGFYNVDQDGRQQLVVRMENAFDEEYATGFRTATRDAGGALLSASVGVPRTLHFSYRYRF